MTDVEILGHIVKYKLPSSIQGSLTRHRSQLQDLLTMIEEFDMPHFKNNSTANKMTSTKWHEFNDMKYLVKEIHKNMSWKDCTVECALIFSCKHVYGSTYIKKTMAN